MNQKGRPKVAESKKRNKRLAYSSDAAGIAALKSVAKRAGQNVSEWITSIVQREQAK